MPNLSQQNWQILAYRSGILAIGCMPFLYLFAGRNNICIWITGISFRSFNIYHRHIARAATVLGIVHGISFTVLCSHFLHIYVQRVRLEYFYMGIMALVAMSVLLLQATSWLRRRWYDAFLLVHTALGILVIIALFRYSSFHTTVHTHKANYSQSYQTHEQAVRWISVPHDRGVGIRSRRTTGPPCLLQLPCQVWKRHVENVGSRQIY